MPETESGKCDTVTKNHWATQCGVDPSLVDVYYVPDNMLAYNGPCEITVHGVAVSLVNNNNCEDSGPGSSASLCEVGYDYPDCPVRNSFVPPPTPPYAPIVYIQSHSPRGSGGGLAISLVVLCGCCGLCSTVWKSRRRGDRRTPRSAYATVPSGALPQLP